MQFKIESMSLATAVDNTNGLLKHEERIHEALFGAFFMLEVRLGFLLTVLLGRIGSGPTRFPPTNFHILLLRSSFVNHGRDHRSGLRGSVP